MNSYQKRLQEIAYLKERVAQLENYLHPEITEMLRDEAKPKLNSQALYGGCAGGSMKSSHPIWTRERFDALWHFKKPKS